jgi:hypothetical protein
MESHVIEGQNKCLHIPFRNSAVHPPFSAPPASHKYSRLIHPEKKSRPQGRNLISITKSHDRLSTASPSLSRLNPLQISSHVNFEQLNRAKCRTGNLVVSVFVFRRSESGSHLLFLILVVLVVRTLLDTFFGGRLGKLPDDARHRQNIKIILTIHNFKKLVEGLWGLSFSEASPR